jgi:hypothetical protein
MTLMDEMMTGLCRHLDDSRAVACGFLVFFMFSD